MYNRNGVVYNETHSISFGTVSNHTFTTKANTWSTWHMIPSSKPFVSNAPAVLKLIAIPGSDEKIDLTTYLTGSAKKGVRTGSFEFYVDTNQDNIESVRMSIMNALHGKRLHMRLMDDPTHYYIGRYNIRTPNVGASYPVIVIEYQLDPEKYTL